MPLSLWAAFFKPRLRYTIFIYLFSFKKAIVAFAPNNLCLKDTNCSTNSWTIIKMLNDNFQGFIFYLKD